MKPMSHTRTARRSILRAILSTTIAVMTLLSAHALARPSPPAGMQRIRFTTGAISAQVRGQFSAAQPRVRYLIKAKAGDHMVVNVIPVTKMLTMAGTVTTPSGQGDGQPGGIIFNGDLTENGDYTIEVSQHTMGSNYKSGSFIVEVVITPAWLKS